jgi:hypothetical protein
LCEDALLRVNPKRQNPNAKKYFKTGAMRVVGDYLKFLWDLIIGVWDFYRLPL